MSEKQTIHLWKKMFGWFQGKLSVWLVSGQVVSLAGFRASCHFGWFQGNVLFR
jgi:hypothetical protein